MSRLASAGETGDPIGPTPLTSSPGSTGARLPDVTNWDDSPSDVQKFFECLPCIGHDGALSWVRQQFGNGRCAKYHAAVSARTGLQDRRNTGLENRYGVAQFGPTPNSSNKHDALVSGWPGFARRPSLASRVRVRSRGTVGGKADFRRHKLILGACMVWLIGGDLPSLALRACMVWLIGGDLPSLALRACMVWLFYGDVPSLALGLVWCG